MMWKNLALVLIIAGGVFMAHGYPDYEGGKSGLYPMTAWAAVEGIDLTFSNTGNNLPTATALASSAVIAAGEKLFITQLAFMSQANLAADRDNNQMCWMRISRTRGGILTQLFYMGGNGGGSFVFPTPLVFIAGDTITITLVNAANHNCDMSYHVGAYEIPA